MQSANLLVRKLQLMAPLDAADIAAVEALPMRLKEMKARTPIANEGNHPRECCTVVRGMVVRSKVAESGKRQILSFHIPGDVPDLESLFLAELDHDLSTLSTAILAFVSHQDLLDVIRSRPMVAQALWKCTLIDAAILREWIINLALRPAVARMAHLIAELHYRMAAVGLSSENQFDFPLSQARLGEALGISTVHVNRVLQELRGADVVDIRSNRVTITDLSTLNKMAGFNSVYLHDPRVQPVMVPDPS